MITQMPSQGGGEDALTNPVQCWAESILYNIASWIKRLCQAVFWRHMPWNAASLGCFVLACNKMTAFCEVSCLWSSSVKKEVGAPLSLILTWSVLLSYCNSAYAREDGIAAYSSRVSHHHHRLPFLLLSPSCLFVDDCKPSTAGICFPLCCEAPHKLMALYLHSIIII